MIVDVSAFICALLLMICSCIVIVMSSEMYTQNGNRNCALAAPWDYYVNGGGGWLGVLELSSQVDAYST